MTSQERESLLNDGCLHIAEAARFSGLSKSSLYLAMERGDLLYVKVGRRRLIPRAGLIQWLAEHVGGDSGK